MVLHEVKESCSLGELEEAKAGGPQPWEHVADFVNR